MSPAVVKNRKEQFPVRLRAVLRYWTALDTIDRFLAFSNPRWDLQMPYSPDRTY